ncbi:MAG: outer membrane protein assembly factor BamA [bacterium]|nr:outer membrane protein assembly factor BamA [bacterium]
MGSGTARRAAGLSICLLAMVCAGRVRAEATSNIVADILIVGNNRVAEKVIRDQLQTKVGEYYDNETAKKDSEALMKRGDFAEVLIEQEPQDGKVVLTYRITERPLIGTLSIVGAKFIKLAKIEAVIKSKVRMTADPSVFKNDVERIKELYANKGYAQAKVAYTVTAGTNAASVAVVFNIVEGNPSYVKQVTISGNTNISTMQIEWAMETKPRLLVLFRTGVFDEYTLKEDMYRITELYQKAGYVEARAIYAFEPTKEKDGLAVRVRIIEGPPYTVGKIKITQLRMKGGMATNLFYEVGLYRGGKYSPQAMENDADALRNYYRAFGYADAMVTTKAIMSPKSRPGQKVVDVQYVVKERTIYDFGNVEVTGNSKTKREVILRELNVKPGDRYNFYRLETSKQRLMNLDYFDKVDVRDVTSKSVPNAKDVYVDVKEKNTGKLGFGAGYSSVDSFVGFAEVSQSNFDALNWNKWFVGGGQKVRLRAEIGNKRQDIVFSFTEPYFLYDTLHGRKVSAGFDLFARNWDFLAPDYRIQRLGGDLRLGTPVNFDWVPYLGKYIGSIRADLTAIGEIIKVDVGDTLDYGNRVLNSDARLIQWVNPNTGRLRMIYPGWAFATKDKYLEEDAGTFVQFAPVLTFTRDTRDSITLPTSGGESKLIGKAGMGSTFYGLGELKHEQYFKMFETFQRKPNTVMGVGNLFGGPHVLEVRGAVGFATPNTPMFDRFFMGGPYEMRGFGYRMVGPKDFIGQNPLGGTSKLFGSVEYTFPIYEYSEKFSVRGAIFMDVGNVWYKSRKYTLGTIDQNGNWYAYNETRDNFGEINLTGGMGLRVNLPIGPLRFDYGIPFIRDSESQNWKPFDGFSFNAGASF